MSSASTGGPVQPTRGILRPLGPEEVAITGGFWAERQAVNAEATIAHCEQWMERIGWIRNFDRVADGTIAAARAGVEFVDSEVYKLLEAMTWELGRRPDPALEQRYTALVQRVATAQEEDGYLHTAFGRHGQPERYSNLEFGHELYCFGHLFQAAVARLRTGHDDLLPHVARRLADHVYTVFGPNGRVAVCGHPEIEMGLAELSRALDEPRYLELAKLFIDRRGTGTLGVSPFGQEYFQDDVPLRQATTMRGHAVRALYLASGALDVATETDDPELASAVELQWANAVARRTYLTGGVGSHHQDEAYGDDFELPPDRAYSETCAGIASVMLSWRLLLRTGEEQYADLMERTLLNNVLASPRADGKAFFYTNTLHQRTPGSVPDEHTLSHRAEASLRAPWFEVSCCPTNVARTLASVGLYFVTATDDGIQFHQYGDYEIATELDAGAVRLRVSTGYPYDGDVEVAVLAAPCADTALRFRVPSWTAADQVTVSETGAERGPGFVEIRRVLHAGDVIRIRFPLQPRVTWPDPRIDAVRGDFAIERGPLVLALESTDLPAGWNVNDVEADPASVAEESGATRLTVLRRSPKDTAWPYLPQGPGPAAQKASARLIPYATWANRGPSTMRVWVPAATDH